MHYSATVKSVGSGSNDLDSNLRLNTCQLWKAVNLSKFQFLEMGLRIVPTSQACDED